MCVYDTVQAICEQRVQGDGVFCDQNKCYLPWTRDVLDFRNVASQGRETAPSKGRGGNQIVAYAPPIMNPHSV